MGFICKRAKLHEKVCVHFQCERDVFYFKYLEIRRLVAETDKDLALMKATSKKLNYQCEKWKCLDFCLEHCH